MVWRWAVSYTHLDVYKRQDYASAKTSDTQAFGRYANWMFDHGIYVAPSQFEAMFVSMAHTEEDIQQTLDVVEEYLKR